MFIGEPPGNAEDLKGRWLQAEITSFVPAPTNERRHAELARFIGDLKKIQKAIA